MRRIKGFTLFEILIVLFIIGIVTSIAMLTINFNQNAQLERTAKELVQSLTLAEEFAIVQQKTIGCVFTQKNYYFVFYEFQLGKSAQWKKLEQPPFQKHALPSKISLYFEPDEKAVKTSRETDSLFPQIVITSDGSIAAPFVLWVAVQGSSPRYKIIGEINGRIDMEKL